MQQLYQLISAVARNPLTVLIAGESGHREGAGGAGDPPAGPRAATSRSFR